MLQISYVDYFLIFILILLTDFHLKNFGDLYFVFATNFIVSQLDWLKYLKALIMLLMLDY